MIEKTFADFRCDQMLALHCLGLREERFNREKEIRLRRLKNKITINPKIDIDNLLFGESDGFKNKSEKRKKRKERKYLEPRARKLRDLRARPSSWEGLR